MIKIDITKAKNIAHDIRRKLREQEFSPLDNKIAKQIPGVNFSEIEMQREMIREKYHIIQKEIDNANDIYHIKKILNI